MALDPLSPYNELPPLDERTWPDLKSEQVYDRLIAARTELVRLDAEARHISGAKLLVEPLSWSESIASSKIENISTTTEEYLWERLLPEHQRSGPPREVLHYTDALLQGADLERANSMLTTNHLITIQGIIEPRKSGIRKDGDKAELQNEATKEIIYTPPLGEQLLRDLLADLEQYMNADVIAANDPEGNPQPAQGLDPLLRMAIIHHQFECIHPFRDANGRVGRILMLLYLQHASLLHVPCLYLSGYILPHKDEYYRSLRLATEGDYLPLTLFMLTAVEKQAADTLRRMSDIAKLMGRFEQHLDSIRAQNPQKITAFIFERFYVTKQDLKEGVPMALGTATKYLDELTKAGLLRMKPIGKQFHYFSSDYLRLLS